MTKEEYAMIVAKNLKRIAYERGKTQADIARDLQINSQTDDPETCDRDVK